MPAFNGIKLLNHLYLPEIPGIPGVGMEKAGEGTDTELMFAQWVWWEKRGAGEMRVLTQVAKKSCKQRENEQGDTVRGKKGSRDLSGEQKT